MLHDRLVTGIMDDGIQKKLLAEPKLTYKRALEIAQGCEEAEKNLREMRAPRCDCDSDSANFSKKDTIQKLTSARIPSGCTCYCCGKPGHKIIDCKLRDQICHKCGKKGHLAKVCRSSVTCSLQTAHQGKGKQTCSEKQRKPIHQVDNEADEDSDDSLTSIGAVKQIGGKVPPLKV